MKIPKSPIKAGILSIGVFAVLSIAASLAVQIAPYVYDDVSGTAVTTSPPSDNTTD